MDRDLFIETYGEYTQKEFDLNADFLWDEYQSKIAPNLRLITKFRLGEDFLSEKEIRYVLGVSNNVWKSCKKMFKQLNGALKGKRNLMKFKAEVDLQKAIDENANAKLLEMQFKKYDDDWNKKDEVTLDIPKTIKLEIKDASVDESTLEDE